MTELQLDTHLYDHLDMRALQRSLAIQLPLVEQLGSVRASLVGMHIYQFATGQNPANIDRALLLLKEYSAAWPDALRGEIERAALIRSQGDQSDLQRVFREEAEHLLLLAAFTNPQRERLNHSLRQYQLYACCHLLGGEEQPAYLQLEEIDALLAPKATHPVTLFARQFSERQRKPELIMRELAAHFAAFD